jgi:DNA-binding response OmpR family regulator
LDASRLSYQFGEFALDIARGCVLRAGVEIKLHPKIFETLKYLVGHPGQPDRQSGTDAGGVA